MKEMSVSRRDFMAGASALAIAPAVAPAVTFEQAPEVFQVDVIGCGNRDVGSVGNIMVLPVNSRSGSLLNVPSAGKGVW